MAGRRPLLSSLSRLSPRWAMGHLRRSYGLSRFILAGGCAIGLAVIVLAAVSVWSLHDRELSHAEQELRRLDTVLAEQADRAIHSIDIVLSAVVRDLAAEGIEDTAEYTTRHSDIATHEALRQQARGIPQLDAITMINAGGKLINFSRFWPIPDIDVSDRDYFVALRDHPEQRIFISEPVQNRATGAWTIYLAHRVTGKDGRFVGLVLGAIGLRYFEDFYRDVRPGDDSAISLLRRDGVMLARYPTAPSVVGHSFANAPVFAAILARASKGTMRVRSPVDGAVRIAAASELPHYPLVVVTTQTNAAVLADWRSAAILIGEIALAALIAIALLTTVLIRQVGAHALLTQARSEVNQAVLARAKAEAVSEAKSQFVAAISHELRTPLNAVIGFSEILKAELYGPLGSPRYGEYVNDIHASGRLLLGIVNDILDLSKAEANELTIADEPVDIAALIERAAQMLQPQAEQGGLDLRAEIAGPLPTITGDAKRLLQSVINLISNSVKFTPAGGSIVVSAAAERARVVLRVRDNGIGIAAENLAVVMLPFRQVDSGLARKYDGTGLGLPLTKHFVELHGGTFGLASAPGHGTEATITLPADDRFS